MVDFTKPCTVDGRPVRILCTDRPDRMPVVFMRDSGSIGFAFANGTRGHNYPPIVNPPKQVSRFYCAYPWGIGSAQSTLENAIERGNYSKQILELVYEDDIIRSTKLHSV